VIDGREIKICKKYANKKGLQNYRPVTLVPSSGREDSNFRPSRHVMSGYASQLRYVLPVIKKGYPYQDNL